MLSNPSRRPLIPRTCGVRLTLRKTKDARLGNDWFTVVIILFATFCVRHRHIYEFCCTTLPPTTSNTFQSTSIPCVLKIARASSAMASNPPVARARIVGPAPERQIPSRPGCVDGVMLLVTSGRPGIWGMMSAGHHTAGSGTDQSLPVGLMDAILHRLVDEFWIWRSLG